MAEIAPDPEDVMSLIDAHTFSVDFGSLGRRSASSTTAH
jgi:hypothetical protein